MWQSLRDLLNVECNEDRKPEHKVLANAKTGHWELGSEDQLCDSEVENEKTRKWMGIEGNKIGEKRKKEKMEIGQILDTPTCKFSLDSCQVNHSGVCNTLQVYIWACSYYVCCSGNNGFVKLIVFSLTQVKSKLASRINTIQDAWLEI